MDPKDTLPELDDVFARWAIAEHTPAIAWGLIQDGELVAARGLGTLRVGEDARPDHASVFRIASMTKSFTGAALMSLVVDGAVRLDEPVARYVPELAGWRGPTTDGPPLTVRHLTSMESGLPTDDPWADRHLDLPPEGMDALIEAGASFTWTPGIRFEYSNLGWGLIGRVIERTAGVTPQALVTQRFLEPLGMTDTTWTRPDVANVAEPYRWQDGDWDAELEPPGDGTIAPMGGLWSTVADLARWVTFFCDAYPPRDDPDEGPLARWARREMQQPRRMDSIDEIRTRPSGPARSVAFGYGIGLSMRLDPRLGTIVTHSGGVPGYGSHMRWLPERKVGVVALSNVTYGDMGWACAEALELLADLDALPEAPGVTANPPLQTAAARTVDLLNRWNDDDARALFADNVELDDAFDRRATEAADAVARHGALTMESLDVDTPQRADVIAAGGLVKIELELNHEGKVQWCSLTDRTKPSDAPIITDPATLRELPRSAYVVLRPAADLADSFERWQGEVLDRLGTTPPRTLPASHATLKSFGGSAAPLSSTDEEAIAALVEAWARETPPIELRATGLDVFEEDDGKLVPVALLDMSTGLRTALTSLWSRAAAAELPAGYSDHIGAEGWKGHLSLCYLRAKPEPAVWEPLLAWLHHQDTGDAASTAYEAELVAFGDGTERRLGRFPLLGEQAPLVGEVPS
jgi:CubicO group peptidase (beta-lactamase class C family)/2'-5' RNA ligase